MTTKDTVISGFKVQGQMVLGRRQFSAPFSFQDSLINEARIIHVIRGYSSLVCAGKTLSLKPGTTLLMKADNFINQWHVRDDEDAVDIIGFRLTQNLLQRLYPQGLPAPFSGSPKTNSRKIEAEQAFTISASAEPFQESALLSSYLQSVMLYMQNSQTFSESLVELKIRELVELLPTVDSSGRIVSLLGQLFNSQQPKLQEVVQAHLYTPLKLEDLAFLCHMSESTFTRHFKRVYGTSANKYLTSKRLEKAQQMILHNDISLTQIALECGFEELSYFSRVFKQHYQIAPSQLRKTNR